MEEVALSIQQSYPGVLKLAQTPRWLTTETSRRTSTKGMSTAVLSIAGQHTLQSLGYQFLYVCNSRCRLDKYLPMVPACNVAGIVDSYIPPIGTDALSDRCGVA